MRRKRVDGMWVYTVASVDEYEKWGHVLIVTYLPHRVLDLLKELTIRQQARVYKWLRCECSMCVEREQVENERCLVPALRSVIEYRDALPDRVLRQCLKQGKPTPEAEAIIVMEVMKG